MKGNISEDTTAGCAVAEGESNLPLRVCDQRDQKKFCAPEGPCSIAAYSVFIEVVKGSC